MPGPFGITEVDLPGIYGSVSNLRSARVQQMLGQQQVRASEAALDRQGRIQQILAGAYGRQLNSKSPAQGNETGATPSAAPAAAAPSSPVAAPASTPAATTTQPSYQLPPEIQAQLIAIDPEQGGQIVQAFRQMDTAQRERVAAANDTIARLGQHLLANVPEGEWGAEIRRVAPDLMAHGITAEQIQGVLADPSRRNIMYHVAQARDVEKLAEEARPRYREVEGEVIDERGLPAASHGNPVVYRSPYLVSSAGVFTRPGAGVPPATQAVPQVGEVRRGYRFNGGDPANPQSWAPVGGAQTGAAPDWPIPGGAASGRQNFPQ